MSSSSDGTARMRRIDRAVAETTPRQAQALLSGKTWRTVEGSSGQDIHYSTTDGRDFAWFSEQRRVMAGEWRIDTRPDRRGQPVTRLCLRYPAEAVHPVSRQAGDQWHCRAAGMVFHWVRERADGDPLRLAERTVLPFVSGLSCSTIRQLAAQLDRPAESGRP